MENINEKIEDLTLMQFNRSEHHLLQEKYKDVTRTEAREGFAKGCIAGINLGQFTSIVLGSGLALLFAEKMPSLAPIVGTAAVLLLFLLEYAKRWNLNKINIYRIVNRKKKKEKHKIDLTPYRIAAFSFVLVSMCISFFCAPYVIKATIEHSPLASIDSLEQKFAFKSEEAEEYWEDLQKQAAAKAKDIHTENNWKGVTVGSARDEKLLMDMKEQEMKDSLVSELAYLKKQQDKAIEKAEKSNEAIIEKHEAFCFSFGYVAGAIAIIIDLLLFPLARFKANHDEMKIAEGNSRQELLLSLDQETQVKEERKEKEPSKEQEKKKETVFQEVTKEEKKKEKEQEPVQIGFKKEGDWTTKEGQPAILVRMTRGKNKNKLVAKTEQEIKNAIINQSNPKSKRTLYWKGLLQKF